jgi:hypothetical protein
VVHSFIGFSKFVGTCENGGGGTYMGMMNEFQENHGLDWDGRTCKKGAHARKESGRRVARAGRKQPRENLWRRQQRCRGRARGGSFVQHGPSAVGGSMKVKQAGLDRGSRAQLQKNALLNR